MTALPRGIRENIPDSLDGLTIKREIRGTEIAIRTGHLSDGRLVLVSISVGRDLEAQQIWSAFSQAITIGLEGGLSLKEFVRTFIMPPTPLAFMPQESRGLTLEILNLVFQELANTYPDGLLRKPA